MSEKRKNTTTAAKRRFRVLVRGCMDQGSRSIQQDAFLTSDKQLFSQRGMLAVLADGMGGMNDGDFYSGIATREMVRYFEQTDPDAEICSTLLKAYAWAREEALRVGDENSRGGSTVTAVLVRKRQCALLSVGDSRIYLLRAGSLIQLNREQTLGVRLDEAAALGYVPAEEARYNLYRASLTNHLCVQDDVPPDRCTVPFRLQAGDKLALMSDGVFGAMSEEELAGFLRMPGTAGADAIMDEIRLRKREQQDNFSILLLAFEETETQIDGGRI